MMRTTKWTSAAFAAAAALILACGSANADLTVMHTAQTTASNQSWSGVGWTFNVTAPTVTVLELGIFDSGADGIAGSNALLTTVLFDGQQNVIAQQTFTAAQPGTFDAATNYWFKSISPLDLAVGQYTIVGYGWDGVNLEHNTNLGGPGPIFNGAGAMQFFQSVWTGSDSALPGTWPTATYGPTAPDFFDGPNMRFEVAAVPLPGAVLLGALGLGVAGLRLRRSVS